METGFPEIEEHGEVSEMHSNADRVKVGSFEGGSVMDFLKSSVLSTNSENPLSPKPSSYTPSR